MVLNPVLVWQTEHPYRRGWAGFQARRGRLGGRPPPDGVLGGYNTTPGGQTPGARDPGGELDAGSPQPIARSAPHLGLAVEGEFFPGQALDGVMNDSVRWRGCGRSAG